MIRTTFTFFFFLCIMKFKCIPTTFLSFNWQLYLRIYNLNQMFAFIYNRTMAAIGNHYDPISRSDIITMILSQWVILSLSSYLNEWYYQYQPTDSNTENCQSVWRQTHYEVTDKKNNVRLVSLVSQVVLSYSFWYWT